MRRLLTALAGAIGPSAALAQDAALQPGSAPPPAAATTRAADSDLSDVDLLALDVPVVVTAARREQPITHVPYAISVITKEDIRRSGARNVRDALRLAAGVDVAELSYGNAAVGVRGFHGFLNRQTLVLVDGREIFDAFFGGTVWGAWPVQIEDIERIEVLRGPAGVTWGANAFNGVINIITRDPLDQIGVAAIGRGGSRGSHTEHLGYAFGDEKFRFRISGEYEGSDGFVRGGSLLKPLDDGYSAGRMGIHGILQPNERDRFTVSGGSQVSGDLFPTTPLAGLRPGGNRAQSNFLLLKWAREIERDNAIEWTFFVNDFHTSPGMRAVDYRYQQYAVQFNHTFKPHDEHTLTWGVDSRLDAFDSSDADPFMTLASRVLSGIVGAYVQDEWRFAPKWALTVGGRLDYESYGGFQPSGRASLSHQLTEKTSVYGAVSRAFQMPPAALRQVNTPFLDGLAVARADGDMDAQTLVAYELGTRGQYFDKRLQLNPNVFWHEYWDLTTLSPRLGPPGLIRMSEDNRASASLYGFELESRYRATDKLTLLGNYTYQQLDWEGDGRVFEKDMVSPPKHKFMVGTRYDLTDDLHLDAHLYYVDAVRAPNPHMPFLSRGIDPYMRLDLRAEYEFWDKRAAVAVGVRNLIDDHHPEGGTLFLNNGEVPRMVYGELRVSFK